MYLFPLYELTASYSPGRGLTGNIKNPALNAEGKDDGNHVRVFNAANLATDASTALDRAGFILIGLLSGGDYEEVGLSVDLTLVFVVIASDWCLEGCAWLKTERLRHHDCSRAGALWLRRRARACFKSPKRPLNKPRSVAGYAAH
jgi:hypothetical protein